jgi:hypothetical protein
VLLGIGASYKSGGFAGLRELTHDVLQTIGIHGEAPIVVAPMPSSKQPSTATPTVTLAADEIFWLTIKESKVPALFEEFLAKFPTSSHAKEARTKLDELKRDATLQPTHQPPSAPMRGGRGGPMMMQPDSN